MKLFLIKIGKAFHTIRREGLLRGGKRVTRAFFALFHRVGSGDVLFVTGGVGDSALYRAYHMAEELRLQGFTTGITVQDNPWLSGYADKFSIFIFHRVLFTPSVAKLITRIKEQKKEIIFETDDLVFDPQYLEYMDYFHTMNRLERKLYEHGVGGEILMDTFVTVCTTTTHFLAEKLRALGKKVYIVPNKLSAKDVALAGRLRADIVKYENEKVVRLGYFSGTISHNKDFAVITEALMTVFQKYLQVELFLAGPLDTDSRLLAFADRIERVHYADRERHFANIALIDINLAPLEMGNPFCESKSELKFFEAGIMGVPTIASATDPYRRAIIDGVDGYVASTTDEWIDKLSRLIDNASLRQEMGAKALEKTLRDYSVQNAHQQEYYEYLNSKIRKRV